MKCYTTLYTENPKEIPKTLKANKQIQKTCNLQGQYVKNQLYFNILTPEQSK